MDKILNSEGYKNRRIRGEESHTAKLKEVDVIEIKKYFLSHDLQIGDIKKIAEKYSVSSQVISRIYHNKTWRHIIV